MTMPSDAQTQQNSNVAQRLGYAPDAKLLIIHADDLGVSHAQNLASFEALDQGAVSSASIMMPCPWVTEVAAYAKSNPQADLGLHLTLTSEWKNYRWGPVAPADQVASLLDAHGYLHADAEDAVRRIKPQEAAREIRAQIEKALMMGIRPTHVDSHMVVLNYLATPELISVYINVAHEYNLPFLITKIPGWPPEMYAALKSTDVVVNRVFTAAPPLKPGDWMAYYLNVLETVTPGISELLVHPAYDDVEMKGIAADHPDFGSAWRQRDLNVVTSPEFRNALEKNNITLVTWRDLGNLLR